MSRIKKEETAPFTIRLPLTVKESLEEIADERRWSVNNLINYIIAEYLEEQKTGKKD